MIYYSFKDLGFDATLVFNQILPDVRNILIGCHLLDPNLITRFPSNTIILNTEQIYSDETSWNQNIFAWASNFEVWDYSKRNIEKLNEIGCIRIKHFEIGFQKELARLDKSKNKDVDILFYGSLNDKRKSILEKLAANGLKVKTLFGVYGKERDDWIERSKVVLNHHLYNSQIFEVVRVFYLLSNSIAVVGEVNESTSIEAMCSEGIYAAKYEDLVDGCLEVVRDDFLRRKIEVEALNSISKYPQKLFSEAMIDTWNY